MIRECFLADTGIIFRLVGLSHIGLDPSAIFSVVKKRLPPLPVSGFFIQHIPTPNQEAAMIYYAGADNLIPKPRKSDEEHELHNALSPIYDQLRSRSVGGYLRFYRLNRSIRKVTIREPRILG